MGRLLKFFSSLDEKDCGPTCLKMVAVHYDRNYALEFIRQSCYLNRNGVNILNLSEAAGQLGLESLLLRMTLDGLLKKDIPLPCILHWNQDHFVVLYDIRQKGGRYKFYLADPAIGKVSYRQEDFIRNWYGASDKGVALLLEPAEDFKMDASRFEDNGSQTRFILQYIRNYKKPFLLLSAGMVLATCLSLMFPFLTQYMIDVGIKFKNYNVIILILVSQFFLFLGDTAISVIRSWVLLHLSSRVSISIISDFLSKLLKLPLSFFETKTIGDINQRINDHVRIESFLTGNLINISFSIINIFIYLFILLYYQFSIFLVFLLFSAASIGWVLLFMEKRKKLDYDRFQYMKRSQEDIYEIFNGITELKLNQSEQKKRNRWENIQVSLFKINIKSLSLEQTQRVGYLFFANLKNFLLTFIAAMATVNGHMTLGMLLSISYIIGQTNSPLEQLINFFRTAQDAKISITRLQEIHTKSDEDSRGGELSFEDKNELTAIFNSDIVLENISFQYDGPHSPKVLNDLSLTIPQGKVTAIVGASGCGKTTLIKLLLKFYQPTDGVVLTGRTPLRDIPAKLWRSGCGSVMQDGYIFSDSILNNITLAEEKEVNEAQLKKALYIANIEEFVNALPNGIYTEIGSNGSGLSTGQKQRILIARAVYKDPQFLVFDEATSALDANNERLIVERLNSFFVNKTVVVIAHRLSTVSDADQIVVLDNGCIKEIGGHFELISQKGAYYNLIKNQLELGV